jgi:hypothetical protein
MKSCEVPLFIKFEILFALQIKIALFYNEKQGQTSVRLFSVSSLHLFRATARKLPEMVPDEANVSL